MSQQEYLNQQLCKKCYIKCFSPTKNEIKHMVMTEYEDRCDKCGRINILVEYIED